jgi:hypothetical protein
VKLETSRSCGRYRLRTVAAVITATLVSCSTGQPSGTPGATDAPLPSSPTASPSTFESERHGYRLEVVPGWDVTEYTGTWTSFKQFSPGAEVPGEDVVSSPDGGSFLVANAMVTPKGMTSSDWLAALDRLVARGPDPSCSVRTDTDVLAGERARIVVHRCEEMTIVGRSLTHGGRGYYFTIGFPAGDSATEATLEGIVASIRFVDR